MAILVVVVALAAAAGGWVYSTSQTASADQIAWCSRNYGFVVTEEIAEGVKSVPDTAKVDDAFKKACLVAYSSHQGSAAQLVGSFVSWLPVDESHGYAYFSITNSGASTQTAKCQVSVKDDFGDFGFDSLVGEVVESGQTISGRIALTVGKGSYLINSGEVKNC